MGITQEIHHWWNDADRNERLETSLESLKYMCHHLIDHIERPQITIPVIREMHQHIDDMDHQINSIHHITEEVSFKWRRTTKSIPDPAVGSTVPASLLIPVTIDGFVDGFMIGIACAVSHKAGLILSMANFLEMAFLGMAVSVRIRKCTGSSLAVRYASIVGPPIIMFLATVLGAACGSAAKAIPLLFVTFVSFGVVALLFLVCNELLVESRKVQEEEGEHWWVAGMIFLGVWMVIVMGDVEDYYTALPDILFS
jgi:zinc transporter ZupT